VRPVPSELAARLTRVRERISGAAARAGRRPEQITLVGVSKRQPAEAVAALVAAGLSHCGENFVQEASEKISLVSAQLPVGVSPPRWHFVGRLQRNKAKRAVQLFDVIEAVDRVELAEVLASHAADAGRVLDVLLQVNLSAEPQKGGVEPERIAELALAVTRLPALRLVGLMTVPAANEQPERARPVFARLRELRDGLCRSRPGLTLPELSMGMSADFEIGIEEGATIVRVGSALFGARGGKT